MRNWEGEEHKPSRIASPLAIMTEAPIGAAAFNNEFGRPATLGYFRCFETDFSDNKAFGYHKPIMLAGGIGEIRDKNNFKLQIQENYLVVVLGGPAMLIGLGGGAASSVSSGESDEDLDFASVQRDNAEMERRCQEVINKCSGQENSYIEFIHDVGAGGLSNAIPELAKDSELGVYIELSKIPNADKSMSPMEIWSNESQERYVLAIHKDNKENFEKICKRERCEYAIVGITTSEKLVKLYDEANNNYPVDVPLSMLFGDLPITEIKVNSTPYEEVNEDDSESYDLTDSIVKVLQHPSVASKSFLITIGDRSVGGMVARDQFVGPYQVPVSNYSLSLRSFTSNTGEVIAIGEKPTLALNNPAASLGRANCYPCAYFEEDAGGAEPSIRGRTLHIPINAWFTLDSRCAFPLVSLQYNELEISVTLRSIRELFIVRDVFDNGNNFPYVQPDFNRSEFQLYRFLQTPPAIILDEENYESTISTWNADVHLLSTYCFLSKEEQERVAKNDHVYLIKDVYKTNYSQ